MRRNKGLSKTEVATLREAAEHFLRALRKEHADWTLEDALKAIGAPATPLFLQLAQEAGFSPRVVTLEGEAESIAALARQGVWSSLVIAEESGIPEVRVRQHLAQCPSPYGAAPFGEVSYGSNRTNSDGKSWVPRKITVNGQLSYRGHLYCLGRQYRGRNALVREESSKLIINCQDRPRLELAIRQARTERS